MGSCKANGIKLATLNIRSGRAVGLEAALRAMNQVNVYVDILQETKLWDRIHARQGAGYAVWASTAESRHRGGVSVVWREDAGWQVEGIVNFGPNMESFLLMSGLWRWYVVGAYVPPNEATDVHGVEQTLEASPKGMQAIMLQDVNASLKEPQDSREEDLATALTDSGLVNMKYHFMRRRRYRGAGSWALQMRQEVRKLTGRGNYSIS